MDKQKAILCQKCLKEKLSTVTIKIAANKDIVNLCNSCRISLLNCMFSWGFCGDCCETVSTLKYFLSYREEIILEEE